MFSHQNISQNFLHIVINFLQETAKQYFKTSKSFGTTMRKAGIFLEHFTFISHTEHVKRESILLFIFKLLQNLLAIIAIVFFLDSKVFRSPT